MNVSAIAGLFVTLVAGTAVLGTGDELKMRPPAKEHQWLQKLVGEWENEIEAQVEAEKPLQKTKGTETVRALGEYWTVSEMQGECPLAGPFTSFLTLGYDPDAQKIVGTWVDSLSSHLWRYEGTLDPAGNTLTLETEGPCPMAPEKLTRFREVLQLKGKDHKVMTASVLGEDGKWAPVMTCNSRRKP